MRFLGNQILLNDRCMHEFGSECLANNLELGDLGALYVFQCKQSRQSDWGFRSEGIPVYDQECRSSKATK